MPSWTRVFLQEAPSNAEQLPPRSPQPTAGATVRTDGRKKAALAWTVIRHSAGRKHGHTKKHQTRPRRVYLRRVYSVSQSTLCRFRREIERYRGKPRCCSSFRELGQAAILPRNKGNSKHTEYPVHSTQMTDDSSYLRIIRSLYTPS